MANPRVGDHVMYCVSRSEARPAIVTKVHPGNCVNLVVFAGEHRDFVQGPYPMPCQFFSSVQLNDPIHQRAFEPGTWHRDDQSFTTPKET